MKRTLKFVSVLALVIALLASLLTLSASFVYAAEIGAYNETNDAEKPIYLALGDMSRSMFSSATSALPASSQTKRATLW